MSILLDAAVVVLVILVALLGLRKGFIKSFAGLIGAVFALIIALTLSRFAAELIYEFWIRDGLQQTIFNALSESGANTVEGMLQALPGFLAGMIGGEQQAQIVENTVTDSAYGVSQLLVTALGPAIVNLLMIVLAIVLFILLLIVVRLLLRVLDKVAKVPILKQANAILGFFFGFGKGILLVWLLCSLVAVILPLWGESTAVWLQSAKDGSYLFRGLSGINPISIWFV